MAGAKFILQAVTKANHATLVQDVLSGGQISDVLLSVAFVREAGLAIIEQALAAVAKQTRVFVGIRNDITSIQAVKRLLKMKVQLYGVDTGSRHTIFHPKLYLVIAAPHATAVVGSANLTFGGLYNNIEVSAILSLDLGNADDKAFVDEVLSAFATMLKEHPRHAFQIVDVAHAEALFESGRLVDETIVPAPSPASGLAKGERDALDPMDLWRAKRPSPAVLGAPKKKAPAKVSATQASAAPSPETKYLVWESKPLSARDLSIPKAAGTHPTGSMGWKKGVMDGIDQRHYFRDEVFADLKWVPDGGKSVWERAEAKFELIVKNINYGVFKLGLAHNTDVTSASYAQKNFMTQLHWGVAKPLIAKQDLLGRILYLYRKDTDPPEYTIEID